MHELNFNIFHRLICLNFLILLASAVFSYFTDYSVPNLRLTIIWFRLFVLNLVLKQRLIQYFSIGKCFKSLINQTYINQTCSIWAESYRITPVIRPGPYIRTLLRFSKSWNLGTPPYIRPRWALYTEGYQNSLKTGF